LVEFMGIRDAAGGSAAAFDSDAGKRGGGGCGWQSRSADAPPVLAAGVVGVVFIGSNREPGGSLPVPQRTN
jgi:hypothetical protein